MAEDIRIRDLPPAPSIVAADVVAIDNGTTRKATITDVVNAARPFASQAEAEAGDNPNKAMSPLTTAQAISAQAGQVATEAAEAAVASATALIDGGVY